jgi:hypothetical protein
MLIPAAMPIEKEYRTQHQRFDAIEQSFPVAMAAIIILVQALLAEANMLSWLRTTINHVL